jgi:hypothetical protein
VLSLGAVLLIRNSARNTIAFGQKCAAANCWAYQLDQYRLTNATILTISGTWGLHIEYDLPRMKVERVNEDRWLATDRAVHLNLSFKPLNDPAAPGAPVQLLYDFQRGELYVTSPLQLWRAPDNQSGNPAKNWLTETEFQSVLTRIEP